MHKYILYAAYGWLTLGGLLHFLIDVVSQYARGVRSPSPDTTLFYGMHTAYAVGQVLFGLLGCWLAWRAADVLGQRPVMLLSIVGAACWLAIGFIFFEYWEPKFVAAVFGILMIGAAVTA